MSSKEQRKLVLSLQREQKQKQKKQRKEEEKDERKKERAKRREMCGTVRNSARNMTCVGSAHGGQGDKVNPDAGQNP